MKSHGTSERLVRKPRDACERLSFQRDGRYRLSTDRAQQARRKDNPPDPSTVTVLSSRELGRAVQASAIVIAVLLPHGPLALFVVLRLLLRLG